MFITAVAFSLVHAGSLRLVALTLISGWVWSWIYQRGANLWVLGLSHGVLAALAYPLLLGDNPLGRL